MKRIKKIIIILMFLISIILVIIGITVFKMKKIDLGIVKIGVIDSYISESSLQKMNIKHSINYTECSDESKNNHGEVTLQIIRQECKNCEFFYASVLNEKNKTSIDKIVSAVNWCIKEDVDIICMCLATTENNELLEKIIEEATERGVIIVSSCINLSSIDCYPAMYKDVISVSEGANLNATIIIRNRSFKVKENGRKSNKTGTSVLSAYVCGCIAKEKYKGNNDLNSIINNINDID